MQWLGPFPLKIPTIKNMKLIFHLHINVEENFNWDILNYCSINNKEMNT